MRIHDCPSTFGPLESFCSVSNRRSSFCPESDRSLDCHHPTPNRPVHWDRRQFFGNRNQSPLLISQDPSGRGESPGSRNDFPVRHEVAFPIRTHETQRNTCLNKTRIETIAPAIKTDAIAIAVEETKTEIKAVAAVTADREAPINAAAAKRVKSATSSNRAVDGVSLSH